MVKGAQLLNKLGISLSPQSFALLASLAIAYPKRKSKLISYFHLFGLPLKAF